MSEYRSVLERAASNFAPLDLPLERVERGRDRRGRNRRISAGVVGIAVFVAAVWIVTSLASLDHGDKSAVPAGTGPVQTGPVQTGPVQTGPVGRPAPPLVHASAAPDVVVQLAKCSAGARARLELTDIGDRIKVRYEVHRSPPGHLWHIQMGHGTVPIPGETHAGVEIWRGARVASDSGDFAVVRLHRDTPGFDGFGVGARDPASSQGCGVGASILD